MPSSFQQFVATEWIEGQIRHRRKCNKSLFFIDIQLVGSNEKVQILFRSDDGSMSDIDQQECLRFARPGHTVRLHVGAPTDPTEGQRQSFTTWQSASPPEIIATYADRKPFIPDQPLKRTDDINKNENYEERSKRDLVCKFWINQHTCVRQACPFQHPTGSEYYKIRESWVRERLARRKVVTMDPLDPHQDKKPRELRASIFARWIHSTFCLNGQQPPSSANSHSNNTSSTPEPLILDVAGGKGEISMFLSHGFGVPSIVVEPKARKQPAYWFTRLRRLMERHILVSNDDNGCGIDDQSKVNNSTTSRRTQAWPYPDVKPIFMTTLLDETFLQQHSSLMSKVTLMVGLHADQATEPIVDAAIKLGKPFAVVPCCVFGHENRHRRLANGSPVSTTKDLIQYICEKNTGEYSGRIKRAYLDFEGKNEVVYWIPGEE